MAQQNREVPDVLRNADIQRPRTFQRIFAAYRNLASTRCTHWPVLLAKKNSVSQSVGRRTTATTCGSGWYTQTNEYILQASDKCHEVASRLEIMLQRKERAIPATIDRAKWERKMVTPLRPAAEVQPPKAIPVEMRRFSSGGNPALSWQILKCETQYV